MFIPLISQNLNETTREVFKEQKEEICNSKDRGEESNTSGGDTGSSQKQQARESDAMSQERHGSESAGVQLRPAPTFQRLAQTCSDSHETCIYMYICAHTYAHRNIHVPVHTHEQIHIHAHIPVHKLMHRDLGIILIYACVFTYANTCTHTPLHTHTCTCMNTGTHMLPCMHAHLKTHTCAHTNRCMHNYKHTYHQQTQKHIHAHDCTCSPCS